MKTTFQTILFLFLILLVGSCEKSNENTKNLFSDNFDGTTLNSMWKWNNKPGNWDIGQTRDGWITLNGNFGGNIWCEDETSKIYQELGENKDFDVSTRLYCEWGNNPSDIAGIIVKFPGGDDWVLIKLWMHGDNTGRLEFQSKCNDLISPVPGFNADNGKAEVYLRIQKIGNDYTGYFKKPGDNNWTTIGTTQGNTTLPIHVGLFGGVDQGSGSLLVQFDYFQL